MADKTTKEDRQYLYEYITRKELAKMLRKNYNTLQKTPLQYLPKSYIVGKRRYWKRIDAIRFINHGGSKRVKVDFKLEYKKPSAEKIPFNCPFIRNRIKKIIDAVKLQNSNSRLDILTKQFDVSSFDTSFIQDEEEN